MMKFGVREELYEAAMSEDGSPLVARVLVIYAEAKDGSRYAAPNTMPLDKVAHTEEGIPYLRTEDEEKARRYAGFLMTSYEDLTYNTDDAVRAEYLIGTFDWHEIDPAYGSPAYEDAVSMMTPEELADY